MLTKRQHELLSFLILYQKNHGISPSYDEMREGLKLRSKSTVHSLVEGLKKRGYCKLSPHAARTIEVLKAPDQDIISDINISSPHPGTEIPFFGALPSTIGLDFLNHPKETFQIVREHFPEGDLFSLAIQGDFLKEWGILTKDILILKKTATKRHGGIFLVSVEHELMLRRYRVEGSHVLLETSNKYMIPRAHLETEITLHAEVVGLFRQSGF